MATVQRQLRVVYGTAATGGTLSSATLNLQGGIDLPFEIRDEPMQFVIEMRSFLDEISDFGNNYLLVGGVQFNF